MEELLETLDKIAQGIGCDWQKGVLIENPTDNPLVDAYNDGVHAMASAACNYIQAIIVAKNLEYALQKAGEK